MIKDGDESEENFTFLSSTRGTNGAWGGGRSSDREREKSSRNLIWGKGGYKEVVKAKYGNVFKTWEKKN